MFLAGEASADFYELCLECVHVCKVWNPKGHPKLLQFTNCCYGGYRRRVSICGVGGRLFTKYARVNYCSFIGIFTCAPCSVRTKNKQRKSTTKIDVFENRPAAREI